MHRDSSTAAYVAARLSAAVVQVPRALVVVMVIALLALFAYGCGEQTAEEEPGFGELLAEAEEAESDIAAEPATFISLCANCHDRLDRELDWRQERKLVFNHPAHFAAGIRCEACHQEFPHKPGRTIHVSVERCFLCHGTMHGQDGILASTDCDVCHTEDIAPITPDHQQTDWLRAEGAAVPQHGRKAVDERLYCKMCHEEGYCQDCHQVDMPHPVAWDEEHREAAAGGRSACAQCHTDQYCDTCHHSEFPTLDNWGLLHRSVVGEIGAQSCYECHEETFCADCHVQTGRERGVHGT